MKKKFLSIALAVAVAFSSVAPSVAQAATYDDTMVLINPKSLVPEKTEKGTLYWKVTPKKMIAAANSILTIGEVDGLSTSDVRKVKDKNVFRVKKDGVVLTMYTLGDSYEKSYIYKITLELDYGYTLKEEDGAQFYYYAVAIIAIFSEYSSDTLESILDLISVENDSGSISKQPAKYQFDSTEDRITLTITPYKR